MQDDTTTTDDEKIDALFPDAPEVAAHAKRVMAVLADLDEVDPMGVDLLRGANTFAFSLDLGTAAVYRENRAKIAGLIERGKAMLPEAAAWSAEVWETLSALDDCQRALFARRDAEVWPFIDSVNGHKDLFDLRMLLSRYFDDSFVGVTDPAEGQYVIETREMFGVDEVASPLGRAIHGDPTMFGTATTGTVPNTMPGAVPSEVLRAPKETPAD